MPWKGMPRQLHVGLGATRQLLVMLVEQTPADLQQKHFVWHRPTAMRVTCEAQLMEPWE